jgi:hypothetical protein
MTARTQSAFRSLSGWRISPEADVPPDCGPRILTASSALSRSFEVNELSRDQGVAREAQDLSMNRVLWQDGF